ncbi:hypothetical protein MTR67_029683 [Solanum verrucosum]|uniref:Reverse transcriptase domain-containing protein n=1 Tax=Solanum verrucosum TaxID=315347 RepID=A0AAF0R7Y3_SOLVR|nr:hypothetical protein MTR67_029683 [Solanum verrucosum]
MFDKSFNATYMALIPKKKGAKELKDFRPISLVGSFYKLVSKVLTERLKIMVDTLVDSQQMAFIGGRQIMDAVLIANEAVDSKISQKKPGILCKLDIEKAFDHVNWEYILQVLRQMGFGAKWVNWVKFCISTVKFSILVNGGPEGFFNAQRGIRQGDPMSLFLFILAMEGLNSMVKVANTNGWIRDFEVAGNNNQRMEHIMLNDWEIDLWNCLTSWRVFQLSKGCKKVQIAYGGVDIITDQLWKIFINLRGIAWTMPSKIADTLFSWEEAGVGAGNRERWRNIPSCIWWTIWKERNDRCLRIGGV